MHKYATPLRAFSTPQAQGHYECLLYLKMHPKHFLTPVCLVCPDPLFWCPHYVSHSPQSYCPSNGYWENPTVIQCL